MDRLRHYFLTYKQGPDRAAHAVEITHVYGRDEAHEVIRRSAQDYEAHVAAGTIGHAVRAGVRRSPADPATTSYLLT